MSGTFSNFAEGAPVDHGLYVIDYNGQMAGGTAGAVTLVAVPETGAIMSLLGGAGLLTLFRRRRTA